jgi:hypothetical protein
MRGAATLLVGKPNRREDKPLIIPPKEARKARPPIFGLQQHNMQLPNKKSSGGDDNKSKSSSLVSGENEEDMDESLWEQYFLQQGSPPRENNGDDNDEDDDSFDENGELKPKKAKGTEPIAETVAISRHSERRQSKIAKAQQFQQYLLDSEKQKAMKLELEQSQKEDNIPQTQLQETPVKSRTRGKQTMMLLAANGVRKSMLENRGIPMMSMYMIAALNTTDAGAHKLLGGPSHNQSILTAGTATTSGSSTDLPLPSTGAAVTTATALSTRRNNQRSPSRIQLAPPGLMNLAQRKTSISPMTGSRRTSFAGGGDHQTLRKTSTAPPSSNSNGLSQISEVSSQDGDDSVHREAKGTNQANPKHQQALARLAASRLSSSPLRGRNSFLLSKPGNRSRTSILHKPLSSSTSEPDPTYAESAAVATASAGMTPDRTNLSSPARNTERRVSSASGHGHLRRKSSVANVPTRSELLLESMKSRKVSRILPPVLATGNKQRESGLQLQASLSTSLAEESNATFGSSSSLDPPSKTPPKPSMRRMTKQKPSQSPTKRMSILNPS